MEQEHLEFKYLYVLTHQIFQLDNNGQHYHLILISVTWSQPTLIDTCRFIIPPRDTCHQHIPLCFNCWILQPHVVTEGSSWSIKHGAVHVLINNSWFPFLFFFFYFFALNTPLTALDSLAEYVSVCNQYHRIVNQTLVILRGPSLAKVHVCSSMHTGSEQGVHPCNVPLTTSFQAVYNHISSTAQTLNSSFWNVSMAGICLCS